ncbi:DUF3043 domain-containing protein [Mycetocola zhadangensis]|uniref:DUF3043 domain-containing protein n=1 Tax=Mycetocola zhadangensis TaxID=1164595 RepID=UPI001983FE5F|nr:DUF3043 domain-containing protein [Mycetocola zhadangensis]GGE89782.1 hypothetical protein GCM10011313_10730 [Mycetocola zhadangensis]
MTKHSSGSPAEPTIETPQETADRIAGVSGKGRPTPTRKEREALNKRPLVPGDRKEAKQAARAKLAESREKARLGLAAGDERYLPQKDRGPQKRWVRDYVDARFSVGEFLIPVMFVVILLTFIPRPEVQVYGMLALWAFFIIAILDCIFLGYLVRKKLRAKFGEDKVERGVRWYAGMRALQLRPLRLPKAQVKRGDYPA